MNKYIMLFRGINVGGRNKLPMASLKNILSDHNCKNILTYIQSGNIICDFPDTNLKQLIEKINKDIEDSCHFLPKIFLISTQDYEQAIIHNPYTVQTGKELHFFFLENQCNLENVEKLEELKSRTESFTLKGQILYLYAPDGIGKSKLAKNIEKSLEVTATARNLNTILKLKNLLKE